MAAAGFISVNQESREDASVSGGAGLLAGNIDINSYYSSTYGFTQCFLGGFPASPMMIPGSPGTIPREPGLIPGCLDLIPDFPGMIPGCLDLIPDSQGMIPGCLDLIPDSQRTIPGCQEIIIKDCGFTFLTFDSIKTHLLIVQIV